MLSSHNSENPLKCQKLSREIAVLTSASSSTAIGRSLLLPCSSGWGHRAGTISLTNLTLCCRRRGAGGGFSAACALWAASAFGSRFAGKLGGGEILAITTHLGFPTSDLHFPAADLICRQGTQC